MNIINSLGLPKDVIYGCSTIKVVGRNEMFIQNFKYIIEYNDSIITVKVKEGIINVCGKGLMIENYNCDELKIKGYICEIKYC
ncbi:MAG: YabP/YqfC family sporulation protein [Lachnospiraceae bacterium]|nr:sporulation protein [Lachnospira sp.]MBR6698195.1 YabP/YqfC family sporulation protein [Lachnospiraceae bacterium]